MGRSETRAWRVRPIRSSVSPIYGFWRQRAFWAHLSGPKSGPVFSAQSAHCRESDALQTNCRGAHSADTVCGSAAEGQPHHARRTTNEAHDKRRARSIKRQARATFAPTHCTQSPLTLARRAPHSFGLPCLTLHSSLSFTFHFQPPPITLATRRATHLTFGLCTEPAGSSQRAPLVREGKFDYGL